MPSDGEVDLLERTVELRAIDDHLDATGAHRGGVLVVDGPAGIGKTSLLDTARRRAEGRGFRVLAARGGELEQGFSLGVVRQLFEALIASAGDAERERWLAGSAAPAARVVDPRRAPVQATPEVGYQLMHALYWLVANLTDDGPVLVVVDDAHWADEPSLRVLAFLAARLEGSPAALVLGARPEAEAIARLLLDPRTRVLRPRPLSRDAVARWLTEALPRAPADAFAGACREATGGNPFLVRELLHEIAAEAIVPDGVNAERVGALSPRGVATAVLLRLGGIGPSATALARSVAVLEDASLLDAAAVAGVSEASAGPAAAALVGAGVLAPGSSLRFVHPIVRTAIYEDLPAAERATAHGRAAERLAAVGASADRVAAHLLLAPTGVAWGVPTLREAASRAGALGAHAAAAACLERALREAGDGPDRAGLLIALGQAGLEADLPDAVGHLERALELARGPQELTAAVVTLARGLRYRGRGADAVRALQAVAARLDPADAEHVQALDVELLGCRALSAAGRLALVDWVADRLVEPADPPDSAWEHLTLATLALDAALSGDPVGRVQALADRAIGGIELSADARIAGQVRSMSGLAYLLADRFDRAAALFEALIETTAQQVLAGTHSGMLAQRASLHQRCGRLAEAQADAARALELGGEVQGAQTLLPRAASVLVSVAAEQGATPPPRLLALDGDPDSIATRLLAYSRAELLLAQGELGPAVAQLLAYGERNRRLGWDGPASPWRSEAALALAVLGEADRARELADEELALACRQQSARSLGVALRAVGLLEWGSRREAHLGEAVDVLRESGAQLELARATVSLGIERRHRGATETARDLLRRGHDLAARCHATRLTELAAAELRLAGARPRRTSLTGPESLTPAERRIVDRVAGGRSNREVAQSLFLTEKTVETHLGHAYAKLGIHSRRELAAALAAPDPTPGAGAGP